ncbi:hypothetical protein GCM10022215_13100 [Nocardioides fonticola]|uniref:Uncharacterized protein n=1 Tax=Nocardioides fonticola TaxID=450363 RepID=A0ABP7XG91_9ACTN
MRIPHSVRIADPRGLDQLLVSLLNEPEQHLSSALQPTAPENRVQLNHDDLKRATLTGGPHIWNDADGAPWVTVVYEVVPTPEPLSPVMAGRRPNLEGAW